MPVPVPLPPLPLPPVVCVDGGAHDVTIFVEDALIDSGQERLRQSVHSTNRMGASDLFSTASLSIVPRGPVRQLEPPLPQRQIHQTLRTTIREAVSAGMFLMAPSPLPAEAFS